MQNRPRIVYSLPDGGQSWILLRTGLLDRLAQSADFEWHFISPMARHPEFAEPFARANVSLHPWKLLRPSPVDRQMLWFRQELWRVRLGSSTSRIFAERMRQWEPKRYFLHHQFARLASKIPGAEQIVGRIHGAWMPSGPWGELLDELNPVALILGSGATKPQEVPLARAAAKRGIPCLGIIPSWDNLTSKGPLVAKPTRLAVWCERMRREAVELYGYRADDVVLTGPPQFDPHHRRRTAEDRLAFFQRTGLDPKKRLITYTSVPPGGCPFSAEYVPYFAGLLESGKLPRDCQLLVRLHPQDDFASFQRLAPIPGVRIERPGQSLGSQDGPGALLYYHPTRQDIDHLTDTIAFSDVVLNIASTITLDACVLDRPVLNIAFRPPGGDARFDIGEYYELDHYQPVTRSGASPIVRSEKELCVEIDRALSHPTALSDRRAALAREFDPFQDGGASRRLGDFILNFLGDALQRQATRSARKVA